ncbi:MAG TPA: alpha/beta hydrolase [Pseudonocardia sp.]|uniref:alpha/beta fold hydrolase n=1 Tax=Pseudonocardia sp. TaxID=60912 RepID=UPI002BAEF34A|nr:alpha/beta hydrolase [Pseudonocardia sp.]HTF50910.1 alpha/beta hydrolase [Pseudonocardia sp.]
MYGDRVSFWDSAPLSGGSHEGVVVLVHGIAGSAHSWVPLLAELARRRSRRRVIVPDLLGHGSSSAPWADHSLGGYATGIRDLLAALGHTRATIVGHSFGGGIAAQFAFQFPQHCDRLVLVDSGGLGREVSPLLRAATLPGAELVLPLITDRRVINTVRQGEQLARRLLPGLSPSTWEAARSFASLADPAHRRAFIHTTRSVVDAGGQRVRATDRLYLTKGLPTLIAWGTADTMIPVEHGHRAHELIPGSELALFTGAGHYPHCDQPQQFLNRLLRFLEHTTPANRGSDDLGARIAAHTKLDESIRIRLASKSG